MTDHSNSEVGENGWYIRETGLTKEKQVWHITPTSATRVDVMEPRLNPGCFYEAEPGESIWSTIERQTQWLNKSCTPSPFIHMPIGNGIYYARTARPLALSTINTMYLPECDSENSYLASAQNQLEALISSLRSICRVVQPATQTLNVYGHEIRNLLILASTETEMHWRGVFTANGAPDKNRTSDYVKICNPFKLQEYRVRFNAWPEVGHFAPFVSWDASAPTQSIPWYAAYNGVKHNRDVEFTKATLENAFNAVAACAVMLIAQFGQIAISADLHRSMDFYVPKWSLEEMYLLSVNQGSWSKAVHPGLS